MGVCINRYVGNNDKLQSLGEDREQSKDLPSEAHDSKSQPSHQVAEQVVHKPRIPATYPSIGLDPSLSQSANYNKLCLSLLSGLPNEQDLALGVCTVLSNQEGYMFDLKKAPKLVNLLVAQTGVWLQDDSSLKSLYLESWNGLEGRNMLQFWRSTLDLQNSQLVQLLRLDLGDYDSDCELLNLEGSSGAMNGEGQRVLKVALILHNLSFVRSNVPVLVNSSVCMRFLLLSIHSSWANLKQTAYDTLANIAYEIELRIEKDPCSQVLFQTVIDGLLSPDRFMSIRSMDILSQLCTYPPNEDIVPSKLDLEIYQQMVSFLTVHDIMLLFYTLEALYALSDLGRYACDKIASVRGSIGTLVSLLTLDPGQYGPSAEIKMKIVEVLVPAEPDEMIKKDNKTVAAPSSEPPTVPLASTPVSSHSSKDVTSETFAKNWLKSNYEAFAGQSVPRTDLYADYVSFSTKAGRKAVVNANIFVQCVKSVFPLSDLKKMQSGSGAISYFHSGVRKKSQATPILLANALSSAASTPAKPRPPVASPILKAQLSQSDAAKPATTKTMPTANSTLIKSLLASKVQQRAGTSPQVQKMVIFSSPGGAVMRCMVPQGSRLLPKQGCIVSSSPIAATKVVPVQQQVVQQQTLKQLVNGVQSFEVPMEVTESKSQVNTTGNVVHTPVIQMNCVQQNHTGNTSNTKDSEGSNLESDQNFILSQIQGNTITYRLASRNELQPLSSGNRLFVNSDGKTTDQNGVLVTNSKQLRVEEPAPLQKHKEEICKKAPLLNGLLDKGKTTPMTGDILFNALVENGIEASDVGLEPVRPMQNTSSVIVPPQPQLLANGANVVQIRTSTFSGTAEVQPDQKGVVRLHLESPENSNQGSSDLSSITDIARTLECASESISRTNAECTNPAIQSVVQQQVLVGANNSASQVLVSANPTLSSALGSAGASQVLLSTSAASQVLVSANALQSNSAHQQMLVSTNTPLSSASQVLVSANPTLSSALGSSTSQQVLVSTSTGSQMLVNASALQSSASSVLVNANALQSSASQMLVSGNPNSALVMSGNHAPMVLNANKPNQQIIVVTPSLNQQQQLQLQSPNIKFCILHTLPVPAASADQSNSSEQQLHQITLPQATLKRPLSDPPPVVKKIQRIEELPQTAVQQLSNSSTPTTTTAALVPAAVPETVVVQKPVASDGGFKSKLTAAKAVPIQGVDLLPSEREDKVFSGLSSVASQPPQTSASPPASSSKFEYLCEWKDCGLKFTSPGSVLLHASKVHTPPCEEDMVCLWEGCDSMKRKRFSLLTHLQDWHCNERVLHLQAMRRVQMSQQGQSNLAPPPKPPPHPGYAPDAAVLAIKRHALQYINPKELSEEKESALTKSIRLTSALILRNLVTHSALARTYTRRFEPELAYLAMSPVESAKAIAQCLSYLSGSSD